MKKIIVTLSILFSFSFCKAQWVTIPDVNFAVWLETHYPSCLKNGNQIDTTCSGIVNESSINCSFREIKDLTGIQYFDNLDTLECSYNSLTSLYSLPASLKYLDFSGNSIEDLSFLPTSLAFLNCSFNIWITSLPS